MRPGGAQSPQRQPARLTAHRRCGPCGVGVVDRDRAPSMARRWRRGKRRFSGRISRPPASRVWPGGGGCIRPGGEAQPPLRRDADVGRAARRGSLRLLDALEDNDCGTRRRCQAPRRPGSGSTKACWTATSRHSQSAYRGDHAWRTPSPSGGGAGAATGFCSRRSW